LDLAMSQQRRLALAARLPTRRTRGRPSCRRT